MFWVWKLRKCNESYISRYIDKTYKALVCRGGCTRALFYNQIIMINRLNSKFAQVNNDVLRDKNISLKAKWLYAYFCSCKDDWKFSIDWLQSVLQEWEKAIRSSVRELVENNYLIRYPLRNEWKFEWRERIVNPTKEDLVLYSDPCNRKLPFAEMPITGVTENGEENNNTNINNTNINNINNNKQEDFFSEKDSKPLQTNTLKENPPISRAPHARKKYDTVDAVYEDITENWYIDAVFPNIDHWRLKIELLTMLDWYMKKKWWVIIPKSAVKNWLKDKQYNKIIVRENNSWPWREKEMEESFNS